LNDSAFDIGEIIDAFKRRAWLLVASIVVLTPIGLLVALLLPPSYSSTARILVQSQQIPNDLVRTTVEVAAGERLALIQQRLTTRSSLLEMSERMQLYENRPRMSRTEIVEDIRDSIEIEEIALGGRRAARRGDALASAFTVTYRAESPVVAARVANELVTMVLRDNIENRSRRASETREFLQKKKQDLATELSRAETAIAGFKAENAGSLPETLNSRQDELLSVQQRVFELETQRLTLDSGRRELEDAIDRGLTFAQAGGSRSPAEQQLEVLKRQLAEARGIFSASHPKIKALQASIASLEASIASEGGGSAADDGVTSSRTELSRRLGRVQRQLDLLDKEINTHRERMTELRDTIAKTPDVEIALDALLRNRDALAKQLQDATLKEAQAADGEILEVNRQAERFEILEQAQIPEEPDSPPRKLISIASFGGSIAIGVALIILMELLNRTIRTTRGLVAQVGIAPIVAIPLIRTAEENTKRRVSTAVYLLLLLALGAAFLFLIDQYVAPLDRLITNLMDDAKLTPLVEEAREKVGALMHQGKGLLRGLFGSL